MIVINLLLWFTLACQGIPIEPELVAAVAVVESSTKNEMIRIGPLGRKGTYIGPMGLHKAFRQKWDIDDPVTNIRIGAWTLCKNIRKTGSIKGALREYNTKYNDGYGRAVIACYKKFKREKETQSK